MNEIFISWILFVSIWAFAAMGYDKRQAKRKARRVPEKNLWFLAFVGGAIGSYVGMLIFNHKTRRTTFRIGFLLLAVVYILLILYLLGIDILKITSR